VRLPTVKAALGYDPVMAAKSSTRSSTRKGGRSTKLTPALLKRLESLIGAGSGREAAARAVGISERTFHNWVERGRAGEEPYVQFLQRIEAASDTLQAEVGQVLIRSLRSKDLRIASKTAMWMGERLWPAKYGRRQEITGVNGGPLEVKATVEAQLSNEQLKRISPETRAAVIRDLMGAEADQPAPSSER
jgi:transposase